MAQQSTTPSSRPSRPLSRGPTTSRPTTPLRRSSRGSLRGSNTRPDDEFPLSAMEPMFAELTDGLVTLENNFADLQVMHDSLSRFSESFAAFLYGLNMNAFCVDFPEAPDGPAFKRFAEREERMSGEAGARGGYGSSRDFDGEATFMTNDTSFVNDPTPVPPSTKQSTPTPLKTPARRVPATRGDAGGRGGRMRGIPRGRGGYGYGYNK